MRKENCSNLGLYFVTKFKVGDRVVVARLTPKSTKDKEDELGQSFVVAEVDGRWGYPYFLAGADWLYQDAELELESVYNSPLYQALE